MYKTINNLLHFFTIIVYIGFGMPIMGLLKDRGRGVTDSLFHYNKTIYLKSSLIGIVIAILSIAICIVLKKKIKQMDCEIKSLPPYNAPVVKYQLYKSSIYSVVFSIDGKKYQHKFKAIGVKKVYDFNKGSYVRYRNYKDEIIPETFYLAIPKYEKGIKNKWAYLSENQ
ncbi:hypothetical protein JHL18_16720 [Clostridium sp. YIM B02505]|uniref:Uncharacterized protein n=1 Tax=Clostridium yunnanense TaxID=2800325 RepID=A0ABS1ESI8_9CLOT|nr:hypothetical protein [Clostridium yunnanense]MBK1812268.1 hypothetical protein [Clostridium yunnanense]